MTARLRLLDFTRFLSLAVVALLVAACGGGDSTPSRPLARLAGQLRAAGSGPAQGPLRLALAWYPGLVSEHGQALSQPGAIETQEVAYAGALPQAYVFDVSEAPPASALQPMPEGYVGLGAIAILLAYRDGNGNARLDTIPEDGAPVDHVVGASLEWTAAPAYLVVYLTNDQPAFPDLEAGFNLLEIVDAERTNVVALTTPIPVSVSEGGPLLDLFVCEAAWDGSSTQAPCGLALDEPALDVLVEGEIYASSTSVEAAFGLDDVVDGQKIRITDATVTLDGVRIPFDPESGFYYSPDLAPAMFAEARTVELVAKRGNAVLRRSIDVPAFELTDVPETVVSGTAFDVAWTVPASAASFNLFLFGEGNFFLNVQGLEDSPYHVAALDYVGPARLTIAALSSGEIPVTVVRTTTLAFEPAEAAVAAR